MKSIPIQNLYYLLCYAWDHLEERDEIEVADDGNTELAELFARVLVHGTQRLLKRGFYRDYHELQEETPRLRGRMEFTPSVRQLSWLKGRMVCAYTELSYDTLPNRILKAALRCLMEANGLKDRSKSLWAELATLYDHLREVSDIRITGRDFSRVQLHGNLRSYRFILRVCELVHYAILPSDGSGTRRFRDFSRDERMAALFEAFVRNFYQRESPEFAAGRSNPVWQELEALDPAGMSHFPRMQTDIELRRGTRHIILDCKYYLNALSEHHDRQKFHSTNLYQIYAYLQNLQLMHPGRAFEGILLYPETGESFCHRYTLQGHGLTLCTLNLNQPWPGIARDLKALLAEFPQQLPGSSSK
ncbi:MAG: 5-methylcytosine-specific restriction enzyme subunit McrC [Puniceicoccaceae bacterium 5H]|nr:MAG: 5-methylcytosine-specific restriction enzyme subunit McrC [Puniceicoccaceae bacterium 5H]